ncbi:hypothetical protein EDC01DRAFT_640680 [Geopyxis carbonaria]|nr:hypothetical protein EDC01DRAFT_640680 [Geopyxis carbonaria]
MVDRNAIHTHGGAHSGNNTQKTHWTLPKKSLLDVVGPYRGPGWPTGDNDTPSTPQRPPRQRFSKKPEPPLIVTRSKFTAAKLPSNWEVLNPNFTNGTAAHGLSPAKSLSLRHSCKRADISSDFRTAAENVTERLGAASLSPPPPAEPEMLLRFVVRRNELKRIYLAEEQFLGQLGMVMESTRTRVHLFGWSRGGFIRDAEFGVGGAEHDRIEAMKILLRLVSTRSWPCTPDGLALVKTGAKMAPPATSSCSLDRFLPSAERKEYIVLEFTRPGLSEEACNAVAACIRGLEVVGESSFGFGHTRNTDGSLTLIVTASLKGASASMDGQKDLSRVLFDQGGFETYYPDPRMTADQKRSWDKLIQRALRSMEQIQQPQEQFPIAPNEKQKEEPKEEPLDQESEESESGDISDLTDSDISFSSGSESSSPHRGPRSRKYVMADLNSNEGTRTRHGGSSSNRSSYQASRGGSSSNRLSTGSGGSGSGGYDGADFSDNNSGERRKRQRRSVNSSGQDGDDERRFACPYYRFEPTNRDHLRCKDKSFPTLARVKGHVLRAHLQPLQCRRCCEFRAGDQGQISHHLQVKNCEKREFVPLDPEIERKGRELSRAGRRNNWAQVCMVIFDCDLASVPPPYFDTTESLHSSTHTTPSTAPVTPAPVTPATEQSINTLFNDAGFQAIVQQRLTNMLSEVLPKLVAQEMPGLISAYHNSQLQYSAPSSATSSAMHSFYNEAPQPRQQQSNFNHRDSGIVDNPSTLPADFDFHRSGTRGPAPLGDLSYEPSISSFESINTGDMGNAEGYQNVPMAFGTSSAYHTPESGMEIVNDESFGQQTHTFPFGYNHTPGPGYL